MKFALLNPNWDFKGSIYFGCQEPHYPLELLFASARLREAGHDSLLVDAPPCGAEFTLRRPARPAFR